jgi:hypothetical protein
MLSCVPWIMWGEPSQVGLPLQRVGNGWAQRRLASCQRALPGLACRPSRLTRGRCVLATTGQCRPPLHCRAEFLGAT